MFQISYRVERDVEDQQTYRQLMWKKGFRPLLSPQHWSWRDNESDQVSGMDQQSYRQLIQNALRLAFSMVTLTF